MSQVETPVGSNIVAVYPDHAAAEKAIQQLHVAGFAKSDLSIIGRDFQVKEEPVGFISPGDYAKAGAATGASFGGLFGLLVGAAVVLIPGVGPVIVAGPLAAALLAGMEGAIAGTALGTLAGALVGWGIPKDRALRYETQMVGGKFIVVVRGVPEVIDRARSLLSPHPPEHIEVYEAVS
jgi:Heat induced stress protein YflT domain